VHTDRATTLVFHLGMSGRWRIDPPRPTSTITSCSRPSATDSRCATRGRFGFVDLVDSATLEAWPPFAAMGPEPLGPGLTADHLRRAFAGRRQAVKLLLLDQRIVAGLGNIYVCEGTVPRANRSAQGGGRGLAAGAGAARAGDSRSARTGPSATADRACATMPGPTASSAISRRDSPSMPRGSAVRARRRRYHRPNRAGRTQHLVLPEMPEVSRFA
jgi:hypothetical protein